MVSAPAWLFASRIACRSDPPPLSARLLTVKMLGTVRSSSISNRPTPPRRLGMGRRRLRGWGYSQRRKDVSIIKRVSQSSDTDVLASARAMSAEALASVDAVSSANEKQPRRIRGYFLVEDGCTDTLRDGRADGYHTLRGASKSL